MADCTHEKISLHNGVLNLENVFTHLAVGSPYAAVVDDESGCVLLDLGVEPADEIARRASTNDFCT